MKARPAHPARAIYAIRVEGQLDPLWAGWFEGMILTNLPGEGQSLIQGFVTDQSALHGLLNRVRDLNLTIIAVRRIESKNLERNGESDEC